MKNTEEGNDLTLLEVSLKDKDKEQNNNNILPWVTYNLHLWTSEERITTAKGGCVLKEGEFELSNNVLSF